MHSRSNNQTGPILTLGLGRIGFLNYDSNTTKKNAFHKGSQGHFTIIFNRILESLDFPRRFSKRLNFFLKKKTDECFWDDFLGKIVLKIRLVKHDWDAIEAAYHPGTNTSPIFIFYYLLKKSY